MGHKWMGKEIHYVKKYIILDECNRPLNVRQMAKKLNRSESSVQTKIRRLQEAEVLPAVDRSKSFEMENLPFSKIEDKRIIEMLKRMFTHEEIGKTLGRSRQSITNRIYILRKYGKLNNLGNKRWDKTAVDLLLKNIKFDVNGFVSNYHELSKILGVQERVISHKVAHLRRDGVIDVKPLPNTSSIKRINYMRRHNSFDLKTNAAPPLSLYEKDGTTVMQVLVKSVEKDGETLLEYRNQNGELLFIKKEPTSSANEVRQ
ncbi:hypothetical protein ID741_001074 [Enterococcus sp. AZ103]